MKIESTSPTPYVLGLDIGTTSVGWACLGLRDGIPQAILATGVRLFDPGMEGTSTDFEKGKETSRAVERRTARLARRQIRRRAARRQLVFDLLQKSGLLPADPVPSRADLTAYIQKLDAELRRKYCPDHDNPHSAQLLVYRIRARAAKEKVELYELGRALLHLAKRRGFNSNLRGVPKDDDEGQVKPAVASLQGILNADNLTLGQYFARQDPFKKRIPSQGIRARWTGREMFVKEFNTIWAEQSRHWPILSPELGKKLSKLIFFQRPLRSAKGLVGKCSLIPWKRRLAAAHPLAQEVRMLQFVNNVRVTPKGEMQRPLNEKEREQALQALSQTGRMKLADFKKVIKIPKGAKLNFAGDDDEHARGMGTTSELKTILGNRWEELTATDQERLFYEVLSFTKRDALIRRARSFWECTEEQALALADLTLEQGYSSHCRQALERLRDLLKLRDPDLNHWPTYSEAKLKARPYSHESDQPADRLPPVVGALTNVTSPAVIRALTEVRKVVNELLARFGKPQFIRIELARDLKRSKKERKKIEDFIKEQTKRRSNALKEIRQEFTSYAEKPGYDSGVEKYLLAEECNWRCPYTGEPIDGVRDLIGDNSRFDIEHIYPRRFLDDSFSNKTLCLHEENRNVKKDRLPYEAYSGNPQKYATILDSVKKFKGPAAASKLQRFMAREVPADFSARQLDETRYISVAAAEYLGTLYGGKNDAEGRQRIFTLTGGLTARMRGYWQLNQILGSDGEKNRDDHRHHAIDAIVIACIDPRLVQALSTASAQAWTLGNYRGPKKFDPPWEGLLDDARRSVRSIFVSHRQSRRLNGPLHADSNYCPRTEQSPKARIRKPLGGLSQAEINGEAIVDPVVRRLVQEKYQELKAQFPSSKPEDCFALLENHPFLTTKKGARIPIHSVRVWASKDPKRIGKKHRIRYVASTGGSNFCTRILAEFDAQGREMRWTDEIVSRCDALRQKGNKTVDPREVFQLFTNEYVLMRDKNNRWQVYRILSLSEGDIELRLHSDARLTKAVQAAKDRVRIGKDLLAKRSFRKVCVSPTGILTDALTGEAINLDELAI